MNDVSTLIEPTKSPTTDSTETTVQMTVQIEPVVSEVAVSVRSEGSAVTGSTDYSLVCDITIPSLSDTPPSVTWTLPSHTTQTGSAVASGGQSYVSRLPLTPLTHDDEGDYTCTAEYIENGATSSASDTYHVPVGKFKSVFGHTCPSNYYDQVLLRCQWK